MAATGSLLLGKFVDLKKYVFGPRLLKIFSYTGFGGREYEPHNLEWFADTFIKSLSLALSLSVYSSPVFVYYVYRKGLMTANQCIYLLKVCSVLGISLGIASILRGIGRITNAEYKKFMQVLEDSKVSGNRTELQSYDFEFFAWPVDFKWSDSIISADSTKNVYDRKDAKTSRSILTKIRLLPCELFEYFVAHTIGRAMAYPGSVKLLQYVMSRHLLSGRSLLIEKGGKRAKLLTRDGNEIDSMFMDRRGAHDNGNTLVICSEGNAAFYELGCMESPMKAGYSVLAWNHPGFAGSSGKPFPPSVRNGIDVVVRYAVTKLNFTLENIVIFAWSIGGFPATYAAMTYPDVKAVVLDATFDDVTELGKSRMPESLSGFVDRVIRKYFHLSNADQLTRYPGPIRIIRRFREEIITTSPGNPRTNRGNFLLIKLLKSRYPKLMTDESIQAVMNYLSVTDFAAQAMVKASIDFNADVCSDIVRGYFGGKRPVFPSSFAEEFDQELKSKLAIYLTTKYMVDFDATHCMPLPSSYFQLPWDHEG